MSGQAKATTFKERTIRTCRECGSMDQTCDKCGEMLGEAMVCFAFSNGNRYHLHPQCFGKWAKLSGVQGTLDSAIKAGGYEGLSGIGCGCFVGDLIPCSDCDRDCTPGYKHTCSMCGHVFCSPEKSDGDDLCMECTLEDDE
jgi:hypothetical protein